VKRYKFIQNSGILEKDDADIELVELLMIETFFLEARYRVLAKLHEVTRF
jgi:hypothetical protein